MTRHSSFWDRRRAAVLAEETARQDPLPEDAPDTRSDDDILSALNLPDPSTLKMGDDFTGFLTRAVPVHIRNRALRQLWRSNPVLACVDGLNDYDADYLTGSINNGPLKTTYQVGKGLLAHIEEQARKAASEAAIDSPVKPDTMDSTPEPEGAETLAFTDHASDPGVADEVEVTDETAPAPRRMRFTFQEGAA